MALVEEGHISTSHDDTRCRAKKRSTINELPLYGTYMEQEEK
jgi:hypothetical protein